MGREELKTVSMNSTLFFFEEYFRKGEQKSEVVSGDECRTESCCFFNMADIACLYVGGNAFLEGGIDLGKEEELIVRTASSNSDKGRNYYTSGEVGCG